MNYFNVGKIVNTQGLQGEMGQSLPYLMKKINLCEQWSLQATVNIKTSISSSLKICTISMISKNIRGTV